MKIIGFKVLVQTPATNSKSGQKPDNKVKMRVLIIVLVIQSSSFNTYYQYS